MTFLRGLWVWIRGFFGRGPRPHRTVVLAELPKQLRAGDVYLIGENGHFWSVALLCPCRCGELIQLNLIIGTRPLWTFELEAKSQGITLRPSVWRTEGCRSHFYLRRGLVEWCHGQETVAQEMGR